MVHEQRRIDLNGNPSAAAQDLLALPSGYPINEYRVERVLGAGGFGTTYLARDTHLDCDVAIKEYLPREAVGRTPELSVRPHSPAAEKSYAWGLERFLLECRALASFHHPSIVRVLRYFRANDTAYMVMEYVCGRPLDEWLSGRLPVSKATLLDIVGPLLDGLETIHAAGFVHRDVKPRNILIRADGSPVLLDFGSARRVSPETDGQAMTTVVTPGFAPAEQYYTRGRQGPWTDIYALAGVMYWMVTGSLPAEALSRLRDDPMPTTVGLADADVYGLPLLRAIDWGLAPNEGDRPQRVADFRRALLGAMATNERTGAAADSGIPGGMLLADGSSLISAVLFVDVAETAGVDESERLQQRARVAGVVSRVIAKIPPSKRLAVNTKEGCAVCLLGDPEDALRAASQIAGWARSRGLVLQTGINLGPVRIQAEPNGRSRILGDGITVACRVMRLSADGEMLVTRAYYELVQQLRRGSTVGFRPAGRRGDPRGRYYEVYVFSQEEGDPDRTLLPAQPTTGARAGDAAAESALPDAARSWLEQHRGELTKILGRRALPRAGNGEELYRLLAALIPDPEKQSAFLAGVLAEQVPTQPPSESLRGLPRVDGPFLAGAEAFTEPPAAATDEARSPEGVDFAITEPPPATDPLAAVSQVNGKVAAAVPATPTTPLAGDVAPALDALSGVDLDHVGMLYARRIGPLAKVLLQREASRAANSEALSQALAKHIENSDERRQFLRELEMPPARRH